MTGLADPVTPPEDRMTYEAVVEAMGGLKATQLSFRFFTVPGMGHCGGGAGPSSFDALSALERWSEHDVAPGQRRGSAPRRATPALCYLKRPNRSSSGLSTGSRMI